MSEKTNTPVTTISSEDTLLPRLWTESHGDLYRKRLMDEAAALAHTHQVPDSLQKWKETENKLRHNLIEKFRLTEPECDLAPIYHGEILCKGYSILKVSFLSAPGIRVTGNLYVPSGKGPFPAILNCHGHFYEGKIHPQVQSRGHVFALRGFVVLTTDAPGAGERGDVEREWQYHGNVKGAGLIMAGDTLMGWQVRDNRRALDFLSSLPSVDKDRLGVTGESGGGGQTMWVSAMDERVKVSVPVVSVGSFEVFVGNSNCICETLPGGLILSEEWGILGLIAPRALLVLNAMQDAVTFSTPVMRKTCEQAQKIYALYGARSKFDFRSLDLKHGYWPEMLQESLGWMLCHLKGEGDGSCTPLPDYEPIEREELLCYPKGKRPDESVYSANKARLLSFARNKSSGTYEDRKKKKKELERLVGWINPSRNVTLEAKQDFPEGRTGGTLKSGRGTSLPMLLQENAGGEVCVVLSPQGKNSPFVSQNWEKGIAAGMTMAAMDFPGTGELAWEKNLETGWEFHDSGRATLWLGYTLVGEWAESLSVLLAFLAHTYPDRKIRVYAEKEAALAAWVCKALDESVAFEVEEEAMPESLEEIYRQGTGSMAWIVPDLLNWGNLEQLRNFARS